MIWKTPYLLLLIMIMVNCVHSIYIAQSISLNMGHGTIMNKLMISERKGNAWLDSNQWSGMLAA